jgi:ABC-2 type transport system permease protein
MIDGFRYGFTGHADAPPALGLAVLLAANGALWLLCRWMFQSGYRLKA